MLDMKMIRLRAKEVQEAAIRRKIPFDVKELIAADDWRRMQMAAAEKLREERNRFAAAISELLRGGRIREAEEKKKEAAALHDRLALAETGLRDAREEFDRLMRLVPNLISPDTPEGDNDRDNVELRTDGQPPQFEFAPKDHVELGRLLDLIDVDRGVKIGGSRQYVLKGNGALLHRAVQQLAVDLLLEQGFTLLELPAMTKEEAFVGTGFFPASRDQSFAVDGENLFLAGTAEVPLVSYYAGETLDLSQPLLLAAAGPCFRSEVGSAGRDVRGLYRVHQFAKVEQVVLCRADLTLAEELLVRITAHAERLLQLLELPYRVVAVCAGDLSAKNYKQFDIETWMPSRNAYGETHSASLLLDYQARRSNIRYWDENGRLAFAYTLNGTMAASPRILIPLLECHQREDGTVRIPKALRPYIRGLEELK
ncbi:serine--tRNA ligase [Paenibacillus humicola]|uniref:serine--tRNA ligase n=1 Tax=Paenibacillus humicola TaxID=3110540 RepID=UPI00237A3B1D|nr:serine--tRNA ligase [Paenibacillus humicola]